MCGLMMKTTAALLSCLFWINTGIDAAQTGPKCGSPQLWSPMVHFLRVVGGAEATYGSHPWLVSLKYRGSHFCGGAILTDCWILSAAHCFASLSKDFLSSVRVVVGEFDHRVEDEEEQIFHIKSVSVHEKYHHALPMSYDIALIKLDRQIRLGARVQPICLPLPDDSFTPATCVVGGWGRMRERGRLPAVLREVQLDLLDPAKCKYVLQTVKSSVLIQRPEWPLPAMTVLCAGRERGGRDACQGDSGGPLVCQTSSGSGHWVVLGVTSWGKGCGRSWGNNRSRSPSRRGSPGLFADVRLLLPWIKLKLREAEGNQQGATSSNLCSVRDGPVTDREGVIRNPSLSGDHYDNNQLCTWSISVAQGHSILLEFVEFKLEDDARCGFDRLTVSVSSHGPVGVFCGSVLPGPILLNNSQNATLLFSSDFNEARNGFVVRHRAVKGHYDAGCGTVVLVTDQTALHSTNYPQSYSNDCAQRWVVHAPQAHIVKLDFADFQLEESDRCLYDSLTVLGDVEGSEEIVVLCGGSVPPPVLSYSSVMVLQFKSDSSITQRGFRATLTFISHTVVQQSSSRTLSHTDLGLDDEDYIVESSGSGL